MVRIRLRRVGAKGQASYRIIVTDSRNKRDGRYIEILGFYNPRTRPETVEYKEDRALYWLQVGAKPSDAVNRFFERNGTLDRLKRLHKGEELEVLVAEAETAKAERPEVDQRTRFASQPQKRAEPAPVAEIVSEAAEEPAEEAEPATEE